MWLTDEERADAKRIQQEMQQEEERKPRLKRVTLEGSYSEIRPGERVECWTSTGKVVLRRES